MGFAGDEPYLSVVATTRNDNHGGDLTKRTQTFIDGLAAQATRHRVPLELVLVEWNPPPDRRSLAEEMRWPKSTPFYRTRVITVPAQVHATLDPEFRLPLYQMIGKNVGIRRARAPFILATNIDLLFSDALFREFKRGLDPDKLYRADRYDIEASVPADASVDDALAYGDSHTMRINRAKGTLVNRNGTWVDTSPSLFSPILASIRHGLKDARHVVRHRLVASGLARNRTAGVMSAAALPFAVAARVFQLSYARVRRRSPRYSSLDDIAKYRFGEIKRGLRIQQKYIRLHTNACGDFTLLSRENWFRFSGYPEWIMYSWHLDSVFMMQLDASHIKVQKFPTKACIYHIEHGGGWTPDHQAALFERLHSRGVGHITDEEFYRLEGELDQVKKQRATKIFNDHNWGLANVQLPETPIAR
jgi:hypothetical protein